MQQDVGGDPAAAETKVPAEEAAAPKFELGEEAKRAQRIIEGIERRRQERARLVGDRLRRGVEIETELRQAWKDRDVRCQAVEEIHLAEVEESARLRVARLDLLRGSYQDLADLRATEVLCREQEIAKLDVSLTQLGKQLEAELRKLNPERKVTA